MAESEFSVRSVGVAAACCIGSVLSGVTVIVNSVGVLLRPMCAEFGWDRGEVSGLLLTAGFSGAIVTPLVGRAIDRIGARRVVLFGAVAFGLATMGGALIQESLIGIYALYALFGLAGAGAGGVAFNKVLSGWFFRHRGLVMALVAVGGAAGAALVPFVTQALIDRTGWRGAYAGLGILVLALAFPSFLLLFREAAPAAGWLGAKLRPTPETSGVTASEAVRSPAFWLLVGAVAANALIGVGLQVHVVFLLTDRGLSPARAVSILSAFGIGGVAGQFLAGYLLDRLDTPRVVVPFFASVLAGLLLLDYGTGVGMMLVAGLLLRIGIGSELSMAPYLIARYFGIRAFGEVYGVLYFLAVLAGGLGPILLGLCFDWTGSYRPALLAFELLAVVSVVLVMRLGPYRYAAGPAARGPTGLEARRCIIRAVGE